MPQIQILSPFVADLIAAGEVVERPASVVKELLENALDAGARHIALEIRGGGRGLIRVTDDGCGMSPEDAGIAFLRHATSKLRDERGLEAIGTLGFRGEALAAIAAVSRIELTTRERGAATGVTMTLHAGEIQEMYETGCPEGTTIAVRDLFFNTPARLKFMGSDRTEGSQCVSAALRCALGRPEASFRCLKDGDEEFSSPGDGRPASCVYGLLGRETSASFLPCETDDGGVRVHGFVSAPTACRGNRSGQYFFCNGRSIRSKALQAALEQAYKNSVMTGRYPACVLYIELSPATVDVNVHPAKTEVKFSDEKRVFDGVYYAALAALQAEKGPVKQTLAESVPLSERPSAGHAAAAPRAGFFRTMRTEEFRTARGPGQPSMHAEPAAPASCPPAGRSVPPLFRDPGAGYALDRPGVHSVPAQSPPAEIREARTETGSASGDAPCLVGEALGVYVIAQRGDDLLLIDKHAAHERILFDRFRTGEAPLMSQILLIPAVFSPGGEEVELLLQNRALLEKLGFELELYGEDAVILRAVPADIDAGEAVPLLEELSGKLREGRSPGAEDVWDKLAHTVACKAAVKAGKSSQPAELLSLIGQILEGDIKYCPHGRPVAVTLTRAELDKRFGR
jgi:DNA mismatch repair protein MutL